MNKEKIGRVILDAQNYFFKRKVIKRDLSIDYSASNDLGKAITITGVRRAGKTSFFRQIAEELSLSREDIIFLDFSDLFLEDFTPSMMDQIYLRYKELYPRRSPVFFLDEIQELGGFETAVKYLLNRSLPVFLTGSSSTLFTRDLASALRGKTINYTLSPLNLNEFFRFRDFQIKTGYTSEETARFNSLIYEYFQWGGFPEVVLTESTETKRNILESYIDIMLLRDVIEKNQIQNIPLIDELFKKSIASFTKQISIHRWFNDCKSQGFRISKDTVYAYLKHLEETGFILLLDPLKSSGTGFRKIYLVDNGLSTAVSRFTMDMGKRLENMVFLDLLNNPGPIYYYRDQGGEVDFITEKLMIQVCYSLTKENIQRELKAFSQVPTSIAETRKKEIITLFKEPKEEGNEKSEAVYPMVHEYGPWALEKPRRN